MIISDDATGIIAVREAVPANLKLSRDDLYRRLMECSQALINERASSRRLEIYLQQIRDEVL